MRKYDNLNVATRDDFNFLIELLGLTTDEFYRYIGTDSSRVTLIAKGERDWSAGCLRLALESFKKVAGDVAVLRPLFKSALEKDYYSFKEWVGKCENAIIYKRIKSSPSRVCIAGLAKSPTIFNRGVVRHQKYLELLKNSCDRYDKIIKDMEFYIEQKEKMDEY